MCGKENCQRLSGERRGETARILKKCFRKKGKEKDLCEKEASRGLLRERGVGGDSGPKGLNKIAATKGKEKVGGFKGKGGISTWSRTHTTEKKPTRKPTKFWISESYEYATVIEIAGGGECLERGKKGRKY